MKSTVAVYQFKDAHPEFNVRDPKATNALEGIRKELNLPFTTQGLEAAYGVAQTRGLLPSPQVLAYQQSLIQQGILPDPNAAEGGDPASNFGSAGFPKRTAQPAQNSPYGFQPPPNVARSAPAQTNGFEQQLDNMSTEDLEKILRRMGQIQ